MGLIGGTFPLRYRGIWINLYLIRGNRSPYSGEYINAA